MTGTIIDFRAYHQLKTARLHYQEPAPGGRAKRVPQIAHIGWLLRELEEAASGGERLPQVLVAEARATIERTRKMLQSWPGGRTGGKPDTIGGDAAQPHVDHALLDRMYGELGLHP